MPDQFVIRLKNYVAKWLELSESSSVDFEALVDLIVRKQFINACSEELAVYLLERGPNDLVELITWDQQYLIAHKQHLGGKTKSTAQPKRAEQRKPTQYKLDTTRTPEVATVLQMITPKRVIRTDQLVMIRQYTVLLALPRVMMVRSTLM